MRHFILLSALLALPALGAEPRAARSRPSNPPAASAPATAPEELAMVGGSESQGVDGAGALGMLTALAASFVFARGRRTAEKTPRR